MAGADLIRELRSRYVPPSIEEAAAEAYADPNIFNLLGLALSPLDVPFRTLGDLTFNVTGSPEAATAAYVIPQGLLGAPKAAAGPLNRAFTALTRGMRNPVVATEVTAPKYLQQSHRMRDTGELSGDPLARQYLESTWGPHARTASSRPAARGQGVWSGDNGTEFNRTFVQEVPTRRHVASDTGALRKVAELGRALDQEGMGAIRFNPQLMRNPEGANAVSIRVGGDDDVMAAYQQLMRKYAGEENAPMFVVQHRPQTGEAVVLDAFGNVNAKDYGPLLEKYFRTRYGVSDNAIDRAYLSKYRFDDPGEGVLFYDDLLGPAP